MVRIIFAFMVFATLISCGSRKRNLIKTAEKVTSKENTKVDSASSLTETAKITDFVKSETNYTTEDDLSELTYTFEPISENTEIDQKIVITNHLGQKTEISTPKGVKTTISNKKQNKKSSGTQTEDKKQDTEVNKQVEAKVQKEVKKVEKKDEQIKNNNVERKTDPFLSGLALVILVAMAVYIIRTLYKRFINNGRY